MQAVPARCGYAIINIDLSENGRNVMVDRLGGDEQAAADLCVLQTLRNHGEYL
jgi:hypothetical protein